MNRLQKLFSQKRNQILSVYLTSGYPEINDTARIIKALEKSGADFIEIGLPFSDPVADGPTIQRSSEIALENGMSTEVLFEQIKDIRKEVQLPLLIMGYINPIIQYGVEAFCKKAAEIGIDGMILPDLPMQEYLDDYKAIFEKYNLSNIFLITPQSSEERVRWIDENSNGFIYMVATAGTTGTRMGITAEQIAYFEKIKAMNLKNVPIVGFGISDKTSFDTACQYVGGAIIGSAFIKALDNQGSLEERIDDFIKSVKK
ncbi:MAG: tryptophan synthase subunit alpha [Cytophagales bacterium]